MAVRYLGLAQTSTEEVRKERHLVTHLDPEDAGKVLRLADRDSEASGEAMLAEHSDSARWRPTIRGQSRSHGTKLDPIDDHTPLRELPNSFGPGESIVIADRHYLVHPLPVFEIEVMSEAIRLPGDIRAVRGQLLLTEKVSEGLVNDLPRFDTRGKGFPSF